MTDPEPNFKEHLEETEQAALNALEELEEVRAYTLKPQEIRDFKAAHYAIRNLLPDHFQRKDVSGVYDE